MNIDELICRVSAYPDEPEWTKKLEQEIQIGTGFHGKWYRSQREHMLGWLVFQQCEARRKGIERENNLAKPMWNRLKCSPLMFWLAEVSGVEAQVLSQAQSAAIQATAINPKDGNPHGKMIREFLPWDVVEPAISTGSKPLPTEQALVVANRAFDRLTQMRPEFKKARAFKA
ncbi:hypothetical protein [Aliiroseovarius sp. S253]|uniref:hypothetical protein n=1 Tax=Aliiroseovarius sp. S253 TaxID=3415133 RepID=UPI003C7C3DF4